MPNLEGVEAEGGAAMPIRIVNHAHFRRQLCGKGLSLHLFWTDKIIGL
jgi:hypothetical protein